MTKTFQEAVPDWTSGQMTSRSGFYAGRGPTRSDLNGELLEMLYAGIKRDVGETQAENFVDFVDQLRDLSASAFLVAFEKFFNAGMANPRVVQGAGDGVALSGHGEALLGEATGAILSALGRSNSDGNPMAHLSIRSDFLRAHGRNVSAQNALRLPWDYLPFEFL